MKLELQLKKEDSNIGSIELEMINRVGYDGLSAYEVAVKNGFEGTQEQWLQWLKEPAVEAGVIAQELAVKVEDLSKDVESSIDKASQVMAEARKSATDAAYAAKNADAAAANVDTITAAAIGKAEQYMAQGEKAYDDMIEKVENMPQLDKDGFYLDPVYVDPTFNYRSGVSLDGSAFVGSYEELNFGGDRTIEVMFTTGNDITSETCVYSQCSGGVSQISISCVSSKLCVRLGDNTLCHDIAADTAYHVVISKFGYNADITINGCYAGKLDVEYAMQTDEVIIGKRDSHSVNNVFEGTVHMVRLYNYGMGEAEVFETWNNGDPLGRVVSSNLRGGKKYLFPAPMDLDGWKCFSGTTEIPKVEEGTIRCTYPAVMNTYQNGIYHILTPLAKGRNIICAYYARCSKQTGSYITAGIGSSSHTLEMVSFNTKLTSDFARYAYYNVHTYDLDMKTLLFYPTHSILNDGYFYIRDVEVCEAGCVAELIPYGLAGKSWRDAINPSRAFISDAGGSIVFDRPAASPIITASGAPDVAARFPGQIYIDQKDKNIYMAMDCGDESNWKLIS